MGEVIQFPRGEPEGEAPKIGHCANCRVECAWPMDGSPWPESCPNGCTPFMVTSYLPEPRAGWRMTSEGWRAK